MIGVAILLLRQRFFSSYNEAVPEFYTGWVNVDPIPVSDVAYLCVYTVHWISYNGDTARASIFNNSLWYVYLP